MVSRSKKHTRLRGTLQSSKATRAKPGSLERLQYFQALISEFEQTDIADYREQIVANLANFAYDPRNSPHLRQLDVTDLLFSCVTKAAVVWGQAATQIDSVDTAADSVGRLAELALGGLSNLAADSQTERNRILAHPELSSVIACLAAPQPLVVIHSLTILIHLFTRSADSDSLKSPSLASLFPAAVRAARSYQRASASKTLGSANSSDPRIGLLSQILLEDCCPT